MRTKYEKVIVYSMIAYTITYLILCMIGDNRIISMMKPLPSFLAYFTLRRYMNSVDNQRQKYTSMTFALFLWFVADLIAMFGEVFNNQLHITMKLVYNVEYALYAGVRCFVLVAVINLYIDATSKINRFQRFSDTITTLNCLFTTLWIVFVRGKTYEIMDERLYKLLHKDLETIFSLLYLTISLAILGVLLITWFHIKGRLTPIGQILIMLGLAEASILDIIMVFNGYHICGSRYVDVLYKFFLALIILASLYNDADIYILLKRKGTNLDKQYGTWTNSFYFFIYALFTYIIVGFQVTILIYLLIVAFYLMSCMYVKQIAITNGLLALEKKYNENLKLYSSVVEQAPLSIVITDIDGNIQYSNPYFTKISGYTPEEAKGKNPRILKSNKTPSSTYDNLWATVTGGATWRGDFINLNKYQQEYQESAVIIPIKGENTATTHYVAIKENVSETLRIKNQLSDQSYFTSQLLDTIPSAIFYVSTSDVFLGTNIEYRKIYGLSPDEIIGKSITETPWVTEDRYQLYKMMKEEALRNNTPCIRQATRRSAHGEDAIVLYSVSAFYLSDGALGGFLGVMTDITELKQKEKELEVALIQANAATEVKSLFLANMSHEIRTPMNAVIGMSYLALQTEMDNKQREYVQYINQAATSLLGIINDILDFSKIESGKMELEQVEFDLDAVITNSLSFLTPKAYEKQLEVLYRLSEDISYRLIGDPLRLGQIITNLVSNAIKFTNQGEIEIDISEEARERDRICLKFSVRDTGIGIVAENQNKLFEAFTQSDNSTTRQFGGTGLGLIICKRMVEAMDGRIWFESEFGKGSNFSFVAWFGLNEEESKMQIPDGLIGSKVLVVDDNSTARSILSEYLETIGFQVDAASNAMEALFMIMKSNMNETYRIIFADWKMPEMDGIKFFQRVLTMEYPDGRPKMLLMVDAGKEYIDELMQEIKIDGFLSKPVSRSVLYDRIHSIYSDTKDHIISEQVIGDNDLLLNGKKVLLVEDNSLNQLIAYELLVRQGMAVDIVNNGKEAVELLLNNQEEPAYDLILMDLQMPVMDGFEATKIIRETYKELPIIAMSARTMQEEKNKCFQAGMNDHIAKPVDPKDLIRTIWRILNPIHIEDIEINPSEKEELLEQYDPQIEVQGIDAKAGMTRASNDIGLYDQLLHNFAVKQAGTLDDIRKGIDNGDFLAIEQYSHMLKGVSGNIGADGIYTICGEIEEIAGTSKDLSEIKQLYENLKEQMEVVVQSILEHLDRKV